MCVHEKVTGLGQNLNVSLIQKKITMFKTLILITGKEKKKENYTKQSETTSVE